MDKEVSKSPEYTKFNCSDWNEKYYDQKRKAIRTRFEHKKDGISGKLLAVHHILNSEYQLMKVY